MRISTRVGRTFRSPFPSRLFVGAGVIVVVHVLGCAARQVSETAPVTEREAALRSFCAAKLTAAATDEAVDAFRFPWTDDEMRARLTRYLEEQGYVVAWEADAVRATSSSEGRPATLDARIVEDGRGLDVRGEIKRPCPSPTPQKRTVICFDATGPFPKGDFIAWAGLGVIEERPVEGPSPSDVKACVDERIERKQS